MAKIAIREVPETFDPCAITAAPGAEIDCASSGHRPAARKSVCGRRASKGIDGGSEGNQTGGSTIAVSRAGWPPVIGPPSLMRSQLMMPERPLPERLAVVR